VAASGATWSVTPPSWRSDVEAWQDLVEEVLRVHGYDNIPAVPMPRPPMPKAVLSPQQRQVNYSRRVLASRGLNETVTWASCPAPRRAVSRRPAAGDSRQPHQRRFGRHAAHSLLPNLITAAGRNAARGHGDCGLFEVGPRFEGGAPGQQVNIARLCAAATPAPPLGRYPPPGGRHGRQGRCVAVLEAAGLILSACRPPASAPGWYHPAFRACSNGNQVVAAFGAIHPRTAAALDVEGRCRCEVFLNAFLCPRRSPARAAPAQGLALQPVERDSLLWWMQPCRRSGPQAARGADRDPDHRGRPVDVYKGRM